MFDRILAPTDGSSECEAALACAFDLARSHDASLRAMYVVDAASYGGLPLETAWEGISETLHEEGRRAVERVRELAPSDLTIDTAVREGRASETIIEDAERADCDLIVMGTHGRGGIDRLLLGSVTETVVRRSPVPVLTVQVGPDAEVVWPQTSKATLE